MDEGLVAVPQVVPQRHLELVGALHELARRAEGRADLKPSTMAVDTHLSRGDSNSGETFRRQSGPWGATNGAKRIAAVDVCGLPLAARVVAANIPEVRTAEFLLEDLAASGQAERLELVMVYKGAPKRSCERLSRQFGFKARQVGCPHPVDPVTGRRVFMPLAHAWRVEVVREHERLGLAPPRLCVRAPRSRSDGVDPAAVRIAATVRTRTVGVVSLTETREAYVADTNNESAASTATTYCPACRGHGTDVHECAERMSVVVQAADLRHLLDVYISNGMVEAEDEAIIGRLWQAVVAAQSGS